MPLAHNCKVHFEIVNTRTPVRFKRLKGHNGTQTLPLEDTSYRVLSLRTNYGSQGISKYIYIKGT